MFENKNVKKYINYFNISNDYKYKSEALEYLNNKRLINYFNDELLLKIITIIIDNNLPFTTSITMAHNLYDTIVFEENSAEITLFLKLLKIIYGSTTNDYYTFNTLFGIFENKKLLINILSCVNNYGLDKEKSEEYYNYLVNSRMFFIDEFAFYSKAMNVLNKIKNIDIINVPSIIEKEISVDKMVSGVYDKLPSMKDLSDMDNKIDKAIDMIDDLEKRINKNNHNLSLKLDLLDSKEREINQYNNETLLSYRNILDEVSNSDKICDSSVKSDSIKILIDELSNNINEELEVDHNEIIDKDNSLYEVIVNQILIDCKRNLKNLGITLDYNDKLDEICRDEIRKNFHVYDDIKYDYFLLYLYALYNNSLTFFEQLQKQIGIENIYCVYLDKNILSIFNEFNIDLVEFIKRDENKAFLKKSDSKNHLALILRLFKKNPEFVVYGGDIDKTLLLLKYFGEDELAFENDKIYRSVNNLREFNEDEIKILSLLYSINPVFHLKYLFTSLKNLMLIFDEKEIANLDDTQQEKIKNIHIDLYGSELNNFKTYTDLIRQIIFTDTDAYIGKNTIYLINEFNVDLSDYLQLSFELSKNICDRYQDYRLVRSKRNKSAVHTELKKQKIKKK